MITVEKAAELLKASEARVSDVEVEDRGYVSARFANLVDPENPYQLVVHPIVERLALKILVMHIAEIRTDSALMKHIAKMNYRLIYGCIGVDSDGEVNFEINHACQDTDVEDPAPEVFGRLLDAARSTVDEVGKLIVHAGMVDAGVPANLARKIMREHFPDKEEESDTETL